MTLMYTVHLMVNTIPTTTWASIVEICHLI
jgi:hypothetical protein